MRAYAKKKKRLLPELQADELRQRTHDEISLAAGTEAFYNRDPVYHVSESFQQTFDMAGNRLAQAIAQQNEKPKEDKALPLSTPAPITQTSTDDIFQRSENGEFLDKFSQIAFNRGTLASSIIRGTGQMMLFTCLKRTVGQYQPKSARQRMLFPGSVRKNVEENPNRVLFNRDTTDSAVGLVADVTRDSRRVTEALSQLQSGENVLDKGSGVNTLGRTYSFLQDEKEKQLIQRYSAELERLKQTPGSEKEQGALEKALEKTQALYRRKQYMKSQFIFKLRQMGDNAQGASALFASEDFLQAINTAVNSGADPNINRPLEGQPKKDDKDRT